MDTTRVWVLVIFTTLSLGDVASDLRDSSSHLLQYLRKPVFLSGQQGVPEQDVSSKTEEGGFRAGFIRSQRDVRQERAAPLGTGNSQFKADDPNNICRKNVTDGFSEYCTGLVDGRYHDVWNPFCGYVECVGERGKQVACDLGSWMGSERPLVDNFMNYCRLPLQKPIKDDVICPKTTGFSKICLTAKLMKKMNLVDG